MNAIVNDVFEVSGRGTILQVHVEDGWPSFGLAAVKLPDGTFTKVTIRGIEWTRWGDPPKRGQTVGLIIREKIDRDVFPLAGSKINQTEKSFVCIYRPRGAAVKRG